MSGKMTLSIDRCPRHDFWAISIGDDDSGDRVTPSKCCGQWSTVRAFKLNEHDWLRIAELATIAAAHIKAFDAAIDAALAAQEQKEGEL